MRMIKIFDTRLLPSDIIYYHCEPGGTNAMRVGEEEFFVGEEEYLSLEIGSAHGKVYQFSAAKTKIMEAVSLLDKHFLEQD